VFKDGTPLHINNVTVPSGKRRSVPWLAEMRESTGAYRSLAGMMAGTFLAALADGGRRVGLFDKALIPVQVQGGNRASR